VDNRGGITADRCVIGFLFSLNNSKFKENKPASNFLPLLSDAFERTAHYAGSIVAGTLKIVTGVVTGEGETERVR